VRVLKGQPQHFLFFTKRQPQHINLLKRHLIMIIIFPARNALIKIYFFKDNLNLIHYKVMKSYSIFYIEIKNMFKTLKFVYAVILFFSVFLVAMNVGGNLFFIFFKFLYLVCCSHIIFLSYFTNIVLLPCFVAEIIQCVTDADCPVIDFRKYKCIDNKCRKICVNKRHPNLPELREYSYSKQGRMSSNEMN
jgi:hypothetical protein